MKLEDIDILNRARSDYMATLDQIRALKHLPNNLGVSCGSTIITKLEQQKGTHVPRLRKVILEEILKIHEEHTAKLMALGITEFFKLPE